MSESQASTGLDERFFDDPSQLSQLLRQRAGSDRAFHLSTSTESHQSGIPASASIFAVPLQPLSGLPDQLQPPVVLAPFNRALSPRRVASTRNVKPALPTHHSAPTSTGFVKETDGAPIMFHSFAGGIDAPGDTQPDSQIYNHYTSAVYPTQETPVARKGSVPKSLFVEHVDEGEGDSPNDGLQFVESSQDQQSPNITSPTVMYDDDVLGVLPPGQYAPTSPLKFETPAIAGRKRDSSGQMLSSAVRTNITTPGTVASAAAFAFPGFGGGGGGASMSLTQVWQNTQAPTSPALPEASEDVAFTRPSPNFTNVRPSSPAEGLSSPIKAMRDETPRSDPPVRSSSEPRAEYVSMKESQERRKRTTREKPVQLVKEDSWEVPSAAQFRIQKRKLKEDLERKAAMSFMHVSAPAPFSPDSSKRRGRKRSVFSPVETAARPAAESRDNDEPIEKPAQAMTTHGQDNDDSPDEFSRDAVKQSSKENRVQVPKTSSHPIGTQSGQSPRHSSQLATPTSQLERESQPQAPASQPLPREALRPHSSRDSVAIMDSQPDTTANYDSIPRPKSLRFPSSPSINQYSINQTTMASKTGYTSQVISSSIPPLPPGLSPEDTANGLDEDIMPEDEEGVPSSPPISAVDGSVTYDEHDQAYDEYAEGGGVRESVEPTAPDEEAASEDEEDLPLTKPEPEEDGNSSPDQEAIEKVDELDLVQHQRVDLGTNHEVSETLEQEQLPQELHEERAQEHSAPAEGIQDSEAPATSPPLRRQRQSTVPETDALEETQPSLFPGDSAMHDDTHQTADPSAPDQTNSTEPFHTANEQLSGSQHDPLLPESSKENGSDSIMADERLRSLQDIHNLPDTQMEEEIEIPRLSGFDDEDENIVNSSSPAPPSAKRRKVTYTTKRNVFRSPVKPMAAPTIDADQFPTSLRDEQGPALVDTPPTSSAQEREDQGANAAVRAREEAQASYTRQATLKTKLAPKPTRVKTQKKGALKSVDREILAAMSSSPSKAEPAVGSRTSTPVTPTKRAKRKAVANVDVAMPDADEERDELADPTPEPASKEAVVKTASDSGEASAGDIIAPNRILASWPGSHFYPAICLGRVAGRQLNVRFDDGNTTTLDASQVRAFDLRPGDHVKVDEAGMKKHTYVIVGFKDKIEDVVAQDSPTTDHRGYSAIVLEEKRRDSLPAAKTLQPLKRISVPMSRIYLTTQLWTRLRDRSYNFSPPNSPSKSTSRIGTPVHAADALTTPSFSRRGMTVPSLLKNATGRAASVASSSARSGSGVFSNMAFMLTSTAMDVDKEELSRVIKSNGGMVLGQGFHELFDYESADAPTSSQSRRQSASVVDGAEGLVLKPSYRDLGFVALISDSHSRSTKYIQALALNVPCLHLRWVQDSLNASRAVPFIKYQLPAGVSKFLDPNGVVRSRTMMPYDPAADDLSFDQTISNRDLLLQNQTVLLVTGKSKKEIEKRQPFIFLTHALGSATVGRCADLAAASDMIRDAQWDWIYVDNGEAGVANAAAELFGTGKPSASGKPKKGKKRKREEGEEKEELVARGEIGGKKVKITCAEFVIQSLILGALVEE
ncbi:hypothetical protein HBI29_197960 [Parastagonospora nodorum]|nr:hypothetical protein HBI09_112520 [Parastagonospora nodorum]KAH4160314.1 hypothetical protein HBH43_177730 [Parastagonospora nodorum]KAH5006813.1 hypothetical protein HBI77_108960 [Parastagonospora nodorum]KAH5491582.1 hypothetical protein HBI29_197960 [Parastagonospora nodorum]KAH6319283.1 hypothetical protein HBI39_003570 [Parastagonospora nodorum]